MAGLGRRTHYRKHLTDSIIYDFPEPGDNERIAKVVATRGGNQFDIILPHDRDDSVEGGNDDDEYLSRNQKPQLAILPTKFNKLVWVKRNDFVIVETVADDDKEEESQVEQEEIQGEKQEQTKVVSKKDENIHDGIRFMISHILYKDQVKHLQAKGLWPTKDKAFAVAGGTRSGDCDNQEIGNVEGDGADAGDDNLVEAEDGIVYDVGYEEDDAYFVNTNRLAKLKVEDSSESESSDEE